MRSKTIISIGVFLLFYVSEMHAQLRIPTFDVELKAQQNLIPGSGSTEGEIEFVETTNFYGGAHVQINQYIAIGGYYGRSFRGEGAFRNGENNIKNEVLQLQKGLDIRFSTSRAKNWRKYFVLNYGQIEMVRINEPLRLSDKTNSLGANFGIMRRLSNNLYLTVIELGAKVLLDTPFWFETEDTHLLMADAKVGLTYNIGKRK